MNRKITAAVAFDTPERRVRIDASAQKLGFEVHWVENGKVTAEDVQDCEIFFGMLPPELLRQAKSLKWLQCSFAGVDCYADQAQYAENIAITNASGAYGITISEHMVVTLLMLMRRMPEYHEMQKKREWYCVGQIKSVMNSVITVVGVGDIGSNFAKRVLPMGAFVRGVRRTEGPKPDFVDEIYTVDRLDEAITGADVVALCLPGTGETRRLFDHERMLKMKPGAILMNVGRGNAVDLLALDELLRSGHLGGAAIDVTEPEPLPPEHPLWTAPHALITPHISGNTSLPLTCDIIVDIFLDNLERYSKGQALQHLVNLKMGY
ncbi:MAG TPA: D-2-hydroxyacid dehydrogenase [Candidatus Ventrousia excrementavium]|uniref:D-2-hydroxyacid dehydrogenase n=1 Tax=Candidatus Ventrousia excrementavium TaxID=2840961 RepID=A0A9D1ITC5_9CLOT|nr:D-2-hydroxyacid dehydrogenase [Candidatus Ventrousia excrementavium]